MKIRVGFVSNSSSESFIIDKKYLNAQQMFLIENHIQYADRYEEEERGYQLNEWDQWKINDQGTSLAFSTMMTNFDMEYFLINIGVDVTKIRNRENYG